MNLLTILPYWLIGCTVLAILNARFWKIMPDAEDNEGMEFKAKK